MRHQKANRKFGRKRGVRKALLAGLMVSLIRDEKIKTTEAKAKEIRPMIEKLVTRARTNDLMGRRLIAARLGNQKTAAKKLVEVLAPKWKEQKGGYTRITKLPPRKSDGALMAVIEFV